MKELIIFENVHKSILDHKDSTHLIFGEEGRFKVRDQDGNIEAKPIVYDILFHSIMTSSDDDSLWIRNIKETVNIIIPYFPFSNIKQMAKPAFAAHKQKPFLNVFAGLRTEPAKFTKSGQKDKALFESLAFYKIQPAIYNNKPGGMELVPKLEFNFYSIIEREKFCELLFSEASETEKYFADQIIRINRDYFN